MGTQLTVLFLGKNTSQITVMELIAQRLVMENSLTTIACPNKDISARLDLNLVALKVSTGLDTS